MTRDMVYISRCIELAKMGRGFVAPNPLVGAVIVHNDKIIGEGYHKSFGEAHAEVNAINSVQDKSLLVDSTIYVSLEPCSHQGKTPPCANLLVDSGFKSVVIGSRDPNPKVQGQGVKLLEENGIKTQVGVLEKECRKLNEHFFTFHEKKRPFVLLKWAETANGKIDNGHSDKQITWISGPESQAIVHSWRAQHQSILVGYKTVLNDNPSLTVRAVQGKNPIRIVVDPTLDLENNSTVFNQESLTIVINSKVNKSTANVKYLIPPEFSAKGILSVLYDENINSVIIEGGAKTLSMFIKSGLWDEACRIIGANSFEKGTDAPIIPGRPYKSEKLAEDEFNFYRNA